MKTSHLNVALTPLLLAMAVGQAYAVDITRTGANGAPGVRGTTDDAPGSPGGAGSAVRHRVATSDAASRLTLNGGHGGDGSAAGTGQAAPVEGTPGGAGGAGGEARGRLSAGRATGNVAAEVNVRGGNGGNGGVACCNPWGTAPSGAGGAAAGTATAATGNGNTRVQVRATGGTGGEVADGGAALARGTSVAINGVATGDVLAVGGNAGAPYDPPGPWSLVHGSQGDATADLTVLGSGAASGRSAAAGRVATANLSVSSSGLVSGWSDASGRDATATLALRGAGGTGTSNATGLHATSSARAYTGGSAVVDLTALAQVDTFYGGASADVHVDSGYGMAATGSAAITGRALAGNVENAHGLNTARVTLLGTGTIVGASQARGADSIFTYEGSYTGYQLGGGEAQSFASGITRGSGDVTITALALGGKSMISDTTYPTKGGNASAVASGQSDSGRVTVTAEAHSYGGTRINSPFDSPQVHASARTTTGGGTSRAEARHASYDLYGEYSALAEASSVGSGGATAVATGINAGGGYGGTLESRATAGGGGMTITTSGRTWLLGADSEVTNAANVGGALYALPDVAGTNAVVSVATGLPSGADVAALLNDSPVLAAADARWIAAGAMGYSNVSQSLVLQSDVRYTFATGGGQHLLLGLFGAPGIASDDFSLDLSVSNDGVPVWTGFFSGSALTALMTDRLIDLGGFGAGMQNLSIAASWSATNQVASDYGFRYLLGVSPVPEPSTWLAMLLGLGTLVMVARRRRV